MAASSQTFGHAIFSDVQIKCMMHDYLAQRRSPERHTRLVEVALNLKYRLLMTSLSSHALGRRRTKSTSCQSLCLTTSMRYSNKTAASHKQSSVIGSRSYCENMANHFETSRFALHGVYAVVRGFRSMMENNVNMCLSGMTHLGLSMQATTLVT